MGLGGSFPKGRDGAKDISNISRGLGSVAQRGNMQVGILQVPVQRMHSKVATPRLDSAQEGISSAL